MNFPKVLEQPLHSILYEIGNLKGYMFVFDFDETIVTREKDCGVAETYKLSYYLMTKHVDVLLRLLKELGAVIVLCTAGGKRVFLYKVYRLIFDHTIHNVKGSKADRIQNLIENEELTNIKKIVVFDDLVSIHLTFLEQFKKQVVLFHVQKAYGIANDVIPFEIRLGSEDFEEDKKLFNEQLANHGICGVETVIDGFVKFCEQFDNKDKKKNEEEIKKTVEKITSTVMKDMNAKK